MSYLAYILDKVRRSPMGALRSARKLVEEFALDRRIGVRTGRKDFRRLASLGGDSNPCQPIPYRVLAELAADLEARGLTNRPFIDVGCGSGRPLAYLSRLPFPRMIGLDLNPEAADRARANAARIKPHWRRAKSIEVRTEDVLRSDLPFPGAVVLLANPFGPATLRAFAERLRDQLRARPDADLCLYYTLPWHGRVIEEVFPAAPVARLDYFEPTCFYRLSAEAARAAEALVGSARRG